MNKLEIWIVIIFIANIVISYFLGKIIRNDVNNYRDKKGYYEILVFCVLWIGIGLGLILHFVG